METHTDPDARLQTLEEAIRLHREEKKLVPDCTCWISQAQKLDAILYACLDVPGKPAERIAALEAAIRANRLGKRDISDCPCWGNAPQIVDTDLYRTLDSWPSEGAK